MSLANMLNVLGVGSDEELGERTWGVFMLPLKGCQHLHMVFI